MYSNPLVLLVTLLLNLARPITCTGQSPRWVHNEQERQLFPPGTLMREEKEIGGLCQPASCLPVGQLAGMGHTQLPSADQRPGCLWAGFPQHQWGKARAGRAWVCCTGIVKEKQNGIRAQVQVHKKLHPFSLAPGSIEHSPHNGLHWKKMLGLVYYRAWQWLGLRSSRSCRPPPWRIVPCTISIWAAVQSSVARPCSCGHRAGQRPKGKGQTMEAETKLDQLIHANLFRSFWCQDEQP